MQDNTARMLKALRNEITEYQIYQRLAQSGRDSKNRDILGQIAADEKGHHDFLRTLTGQEVTPNRWQVWKYYWLSRIFGLTFGLKLMEKGEQAAQKLYQDLAADIPRAARIQEEEEKHERQLLDLLNEEKLRYAGSVVLGLNDALVELTGTLAGLTFALQNTRLIALAGLITGIAASFSMAASEYLSTKTEEGERSAMKSALYTGIAYVVTVFILVTPYLVMADYFVCLGMTIAAAVLIILAFNYYISIARELDFKRRFAEMAFISLGVAAISFAIGYVIRLLLGVEV